MRSEMAFYSEIIWFADEFEADELDYVCKDNWAGLYPKPEEYFSE